MGNMLNLTSAIVRFPLHEHLHADGSGTPHSFLAISGSPSSDELHQTFNDIVTRDHESYKPLPVIHSLSSSISLSWPSATSSMDEWLSIADAAARNSPFLWLGPTAAGHRQPPGLILEQGNNARWHFTLEMAKEAMARQVETLGMFNATVQASSWDGNTYGLRVALMQAMMVSRFSCRLNMLMGFHSTGHQLAVPPGIVLIRSRMRKHEA